MKKTYILDTNVLMHDPRALFAFDDNEVIIPLVVLDELDKHKCGMSQSAMHARMTIRYLDELRALGKLNEGVMTERGGTIKVELNCAAQKVADLDPQRPDNRIINVALHMRDKYDSLRKVIVITKDINMRVKCNALNVDAEDYTSDTVVGDLDELYRGNTEIEVSDAEIDAFYQNGSMGVKNIIRPLYPNEYVLLKSNEKPKHTALAKFDGTGLVKAKSIENVWGVSPRNKEQTFVFDALFDQDIKLVTITGRAGVGKTLLSAAAGISQLLDSRVYKKIIITRPTVPMGKDIGYLPGNKMEKMNPWLAPIYDNLEVIFSDKGSYFVDGLISDGKIEIEALSYIRGRSLPRTYILVDEAQLLTRHEVKTILTRVGEGSKVILSGDIEQIDNNLDSYSNGLTYALEKFKDSEITGHITLEKGERSEIATLASEIL